LGTEPSEQSRLEMLSMLPPLSEAISLCEYYQQNGKYLYVLATSINTIIQLEVDRYPPLSRTEVFDEMLVDVYGIGCVLFIIET
jgi:hypothetical protein